MAVRRLSLEPPLAIFLLIAALGVLLPDRAAAGEADTQSFAQPSLWPLAGVFEVAQAAEPEPPTPQPPEPVLPSPEPPTPLEPERPKPEKPLEQLLLEEGAVLLPQGTLQIEPSFEYAHYSTDQVTIGGFTVFGAIVIGEIRVDDLDRDILTSALTGRYGILDRLQFDLRIPYVYRQDSQTLGVGTADQQEVTTENNNIGDIEASVSWQAFIERDWIPGVILRAQARFPTGEDAFDIPTETFPNGEVLLTRPPTGSGFYGAGPGMTVVWRTDPVVYYAAFSYTFNLSRDVGGEFGDINPGDSVEWQAGINIALSERVALNLTFVDEITADSEQNGEDIAGSSFNDARLVFGSSIALSPNITLLVSAAAGLTDESPDFTFTVSLPITFKLF